MSKTKTILRKYFAAANSYDGFISYFDQIFESESFDRIYVIKGGPGTGKSSLMKKISAEFTGKCSEIDEIYCSSDPNSLDGVILRSENKRSVAMLDGTAPHERDAMIPGAVDELINLGENWNKDWLVSQREEILSRSKNKKNAYKTAYNYLSIAGYSHKYLLKEQMTFFDKYQAKSKAEDIFSNIKTTKPSAETIRLMSSFGKLGHHNIMPLNDEDYQIIKLDGSIYSIGLFLSVCKETLEKYTCEKVIFPSALDPNMLDAIELPQEKIFIVQNSAGEIHCNDFMKIPMLTKERCKVAERIKNDSLNEAHRWFSIASDIHFNLEEIYSKAMNFPKNEQIFNEKAAEIRNILEIAI